MLELGCGDGRDAAAIAPNVQSYLGIDYADNLIRIAEKRHIKNAKFDIADMKKINLQHYGRVNVIFAFASLLHLDRDEVAALFVNSLSILESGGIWYISLKYKPTYASDIKEDQFGERLFYFYNPEVIAEIAGTDFEIVYQNKYVHGGTDWFDVVLRKK